MSVDQLYANGHISVISTRLLGQDKFARLVECNNVAEAVKVLAESGYAYGSETSDYETMLRAELDEALSLLKELCSDGNAVKYFLAKYDYLNAKALMKCKYMRIDGLRFCYNSATVSPAVMQDYILRDDYSVMTDNMAEACDAIDTAYADGKRSPQFTDVKLDKAMYLDMKRYANKCRFKFRFIKEMFDYEVNTANLMTLYRVKKANMSKEEFTDLLIDGGSVSGALLSDMWDDEQNAIDLPATYKRFFELCKSENATLALAEKERKTHLNGIISDNADLLTIQPVLEYFFNKVDEVERVRRVLMGVKSGMDKDKLKDSIK
ncbi:MAG: V-type ATPase subunit [Corallococcus sp.]|nr:V-type ATPase subunit [Corallococcus sp.]